MSSVRPLIPLLITAGILLGGNGLQGTLIALRGAQEGFSPAVIGFMGTFYFCGFLLGCLAITRMMRAVGHVRSFSALAAIASAGTLLLVLVIDPVAWSLIRFATGFCFAGLFTIMESWLNSGVSNHRPGACAGALPHRRHRLGHRRAVPDPGLRRGRLHHLRHHVDDDHLVAGAGVARRPLQPGAAGRGQARPRPGVAHLAARLHRLRRGRGHQQRLPHALARLCRTNRHVGCRRRHLRRRQHHRRRRHPVSARLSFRPLGPPHGAPPAYRRRHAFGAWRSCSSPAPTRSPISSRSSSSARSPCRCSRCRQRTPTTAPARASSCWSTPR